MKITKQIIQWFLKENEEARNSDNILIEDIEKLFWELKPSQSQSIIRMRARIQNEDWKYLPTDEYVRLRRLYYSLKAKTESSNNPYLRWKYFEAKNNYNKLKTTIWTQKCKKS